MTTGKKPILKRVLGRTSFWVRRSFPSFGARLDKLFAWLGIAVMPVPPAYYEDQLCSLHDFGFTKDDDFQRAYQRAIRASGGVDHCVRWRTHILLWVAGQASILEGDFVECGVNTGFMSSALLTWLNWESLGKKLYLLDTFAGPSEEQYSEEEKAEGKWQQVTNLIQAGAYQTDLDAVRANFAEWPSVRIIQGRVPATLCRIDAESIAFLHLDMNCAEPELVALEELWPRVVPGGFVLMDDYAHAGYTTLKHSFDEFARGQDVRILSLPTGQGLLQKNPV